MTPLELLIVAKIKVAKAELRDADAFLCLALESMYSDVIEFSETFTNIQLLQSWIKMQLDGCFTLEGYLYSHDTHAKHERLKWIDAMIQHLKINEENTNERTFDANILGSMVMAGELRRSANPDFSTTGDRDGTW